MQRSASVVIKKLIALGLAAILITLFIRILPTTHKDVNALSLHKGRSYMEQLANKKVNDIETVMKQRKAKDKKVNVTKESFAVRFENTVIMGDSLSQALLDYRLLNANEVLAYRGRRTDNIDKEIQKVIQLAPDKIFMGYGMNDLEYVRGNAKRFVDTYKMQIQKIKKALPNAKIYINSILPIHEKAIAQKPVYGSYKAFNTALKQMCEDNQITYIDNSDLMDWNSSVYERDGIHPLYPYYPIWLQHMAEIAGV